MFKLLVLCAALVASVRANVPFNELVVNTEGGQVRGVEERSGLLGDRWLAWKGIPYAQPPLGNLRFRESIRHPGWSGVRDGSQLGSACPSSGMISDMSGSEDCLFLNVYTQSTVGLRPVMVWIHGGAFIMGDGMDSGPDHLVPEGVLIVSINYRLGVLGFMSTGDRFAPGNYGMKDMVLALRWVQNNIRNFGGDPDNVTIFGLSAGGASVHLLQLSPLARGLFHKVISQSGVAINPWAFQHDPRSVALDLANRLGIPFTNTENLVNQLRNVPVSDLVNNTPGLLAMEVPRGMWPISYVPCIDAPDSQESIFLPRHPIAIMESGDFMDVPLVIGYTSDESLFVIREAVLDPSVTDILNGNRNLVVPTSLWGVDPNSAAGQTIANEFHSYYLNNQPISDSNRYNWTQYNTDLHFAYGVDRVIRLQLQRQSSPIYQYMFSFDGDLNFLKRVLLLTAYPGAMHGDDMPYIWSMARIPVILPSNHANVVRRRMVRMFTDFAKTSNPTPTVDALITALWPRVTANNREFMDVGHDLVPGNHPHGSRMQMWENLRNRFA